MEVQNWGTGIQTGNACDRGVYEMYKFTDNPDGPHNGGY